MLAHLLKSQFKFLEHRYDCYLRDNALSASKMLGRLSIGVESRLVVTEDLSLGVVDIIGGSQLTFRLAACCEHRYRGCITDLVINWVK